MADSAASGQNKVRGTRDAIIHIRAPRGTKQLIEAAASSLGKSLSEFTLESARQNAVDVLLDQRIFAFDPAQSAAFLRALDNPPRAGAKLKALMNRRPVWQR
jgi:uncharacterized protein (DUF1778 family)